MMKSKAPSAIRARKNGGIPGTSVGSAGLGAMGGWARDGAVVVAPKSKWVSPSSSSTSATGSDASTRKRPLIAGHGQSEARSSAGMPDGDLKPRKKLQIPPRFTTKTAVVKVVDLKLVPTSHAAARPPAGPTKIEGRNPVGGDEGGGGAGGVERPQFRDCGLVSDQTWS